jgi:4-amino-4-deoxy-L-arabinose transferase-like glycosyltransferase
LSPKIERFFRSSIRFPGYLVWILLAYGWGLERYSVPFTGDEKVYLSIAMEMREHHDWWHPWLLGEHAYYKPPFQFWATLVGWKIFGFGLFGAFFPSVLATAITAACVGGIARKVFGIARAQVSAPLWFAAAAGTITYGTTAQMEIWIVALFSAAWLAALEYSETGRKRWIVLALVSAGLLSIVKSPLYSVLWVLGYWLYLALSRQLEVFRRISFWLAHVVGVLCGSAWFIAMLATDRQKFLADYLYRETLAKTGGNSSTALHMWGDFGTFVVPFLLPAAFLAIAWMILAKKRYAAQIPFFAGWAALPIVFFSAFPYRTETYLYLLVPLAAILMDLTPSLPAKRTLAWITRANGVLILAAGVLVAAVALAAGMISMTCALALAITALGFGALSFFPLNSRNWRALAGLGLLIALIIRIGAIQLGEKDLEDFTEATRRRDRTLVFLDPGGYIWSDRGLLSIAANQPRSLRARSVDEFSQAMQGGAIGILSDGDWPTVLPLLRAKGPLLTTSWWRWKRSFQIPSFSDFSNLSDHHSPQWKQRNLREYKIVR